MESLTGEFKTTLDDKGRISLPARLRNALEGRSVYLTRGMDDCLWLYPSDEWKVLVNTIMSATSQFSASSRNIRRRIIGPSQEVEIDKAGRIPVPASLREFAGRFKECVVLGQYESIEIWAEDHYREYLKAHEAEFISDSEELSDIWKKKNRDLDI
jgi:MraZ protein